MSFVLFLREQLVHLQICTLPHQGPYMVWILCWMTLSSPSFQRYVVLVYIPLCCLKLSFENPDCILDGASDIFCKSYRAFRPCFEGNLNILFGEFWHIHTVYISPFSCHQLYLSYLHTYKHFLFFVYVQVTYCPDCGRACNYDLKNILGDGELIRGSDFYNDVFSCLFLDECKHMCPLQ